MGGGKNKKRFGCLTNMCGEEQVEDGMFSYVSLLASRTRKNPPLSLPPSK